MTKLFAILTCLFFLEKLYFFCTDFCLYVSIFESRVMVSKTPQVWKSLEILTAYNKQLRSNKRFFWRHSLTTYFIWLLQVFIKERHENWKLLIYFVPKATFKKLASHVMERQAHVNEVSYHRFLPKYLVQITPTFQTITSNWISSRSPNFREFFKGHAEEIEYFFILNRKHFYFSSAV